MYKKITVGFVVQTFDDGGKCVNQEFIAGDNVQYEDAEGNPVDPSDNEQYQSFDMVHPISQGLTEDDKTSIKRFDNHQKRAKVKL